MNNELISHRKQIKDEDITKLIKKAQTETDSTNLLFFCFMKLHDNMDFYIHSLYFYEKLLEVYLRQLRYTASNKT